MNNPPIPITFLPHKIILKIKTGQQSVFGQEETEECEIKNVRVEMNVKERDGKSSAHFSSAGIVFYDCKNSSPKNVCFQTGNTVVFEGREYSVTGVKTALSASKPHHIKVTFV